MRLGSVLGASWARLGAILDRHGRVLGRLVAVLGRLVGVLGPSWPPKSLPRSLQDASQDELQHRSNIDLNLEAFASQKLMENVMKNHSKKTCLSKRTGSAFHVDKWIHAWKNNKRPKKPADLFTTVEAGTIKVSWKSFWIL